MTNKNNFSYAKYLTRVAVCTALISVSSNISIPLFVPATLQVLALYFILFTFGGKVGLISSLAYTAIGLIGVPVFSGFGGGLGKLFEPAGGFIPGFVLASLAYLICECFMPDRKLKIIGVLISLFALYASGGFVLIFLYTDKTNLAVLYSVSFYIAPYFVVDILKILLALFISKRLKNVFR